MILEVNRLNLVARRLLMNDWQRVLRVRGLVEVVLSGMILWSHDFFMMV